MHLLLISGMLGSGKTTLIIKLAQVAAQARRKTAILVNEIGQVGQDDYLMRRLDLDVYELLGGCICCTLTSGLVAPALEKLDAAYDPDLVLREPSGAADPAKVLAALPFYKGRPIESRRNAVLTDPLRLTMLRETITPLITSQIQSAALLIINKADIATPEEMAQAWRRRIYSTSWI